MEATISLSKISLNSQDAWGPSPSYIFEQYRNLPFAPFNKLEKIGKFCDISHPTLTKTTASTINPSNPSNPSVPIEEEEEFKVVETKLIQKPKDQHQVKRRVYPQHQTNTHTQQNQNTSYVPRNIQPQRKNQNRHYHPRVQVIRTKFNDNALIQSNWEYLVDANKANFDKMPVSNVKVTDLKTVGKIPEYDKTLESKTKTKKHAPFVLPNTISLGHGPRSDKYLQKLIAEEKDTETLTIYTTDAILSTLLTVKNSVFPWDIQVVKEGNQIFFEPSEKSKANYIDILTVNENTAGSQPEDEKEMLKLCIESTNVNKKFIELSAKSAELRDFTTAGSANEAPERKVYRYRRWTLDNKINVVCRSEVDSYVKEGEGAAFVKVCALNECQPQLDWKQNFEQSRGALISSELRNNLGKISSWLCQSFLAECNQIKLGFVTKPNPKEAKYSVLAVEDMAATTLSKTINFHLKDTWCVIKTLADILNKEDDGVYTFVKPAYKQSIRVYRLPDREVEEEEEDN